MSDWGGTHIAFYVEDMDAAIAYLAEHDIDVLGGKKPGIDAESGEGLDLRSLPHAMGHAARTGQLPARQDIHGRP